MKDEFFSFNETQEPQSENDKRPTDAPDEGASAADSSAFFMPPTDGNGQMNAPHGTINPPPPTSNLPMVALVLSIVSFCCCGFVLSIVSLCLACVSKSKLGRWDGLAIAALIVSIISLLFNIAAIIFAVLIEMIAAEEAAAAGTLLAML